MLAVNGRGPMNDSVLMEWSTGAAVRIFTPAVDSVYSDILPLENTLGAILTNAADAGLELPRRRYAAVAWGNLKSMVIADTIMFIALNHYLGEDYPGYNNSLWPAYMRSEKTPDNLPYDLAEALVATAYPYQGGENATALSRMIYEGALATAKIRLVPESSAAAALGYSDNQYDWFIHNSAHLWSELASRRMIYDTSAETVSRLVDRAPSTSVVAPYVPGRAGRYVGYRIVCAYLNRYPDTPLATLLSPGFYNDPATLVESQYAGD